MSSCHPIPSPGQLQPGCSRKITVPQIEKSRLQDFSRQYHHHKKSDLWSKIFQRFLEICFFVPKKISWIRWGHAEIIRDQSLPFFAEVWAQEASEERGLMKLGLQDTSFKEKLSQTFKMWNLVYLIGWIYHTFFMISSIKLFLGNKKTTEWHVTTLYDMTSLYHITHDIYEDISCIYILPS